jgi:hypothetical protein
MTERSVAFDKHGVWQLRGTAAEEFGLVNEFLGYLADRNFSPRTCRAYASTCWRSRDGSVMRMWHSRTSMSMCCCGS